MPPMSKCDLDDPTVTERVKKWENGMRRRQTCVLAASLRSLDVLLFGFFSQGKRASGRSIACALASAHTKRCAIKSIKPE